MSPNSNECVMRMIIMSALIRMMITVALRDISVVFNDEYDNECFARYSCFYDDYELF